MTKETLAALYVREALVGREYWVQDLRDGERNAWFGGVTRLFLEMRIQSLPGQCGGC